MAIAGLAAQPAVGSVISGATSGDQVRANAAALRWQPSPDDLAELAARNAGAEPWGSHGAVVGATISRTAVGPEDLDVNGPLLVPGVGAQGGTPESVRAVFGDAVRHVVPSSSREILGAGPDVVALRAAARRTNDQFVALVG